MADADRDRLAQMARSHEDGWALGRVEGALAELELLDVAGEHVDRRLRELVRRHGHVLVRRCTADRGGPLVAVVVAILAATPDSLRSTAFCESCGAAIVWRKSTAGKLCPLDAALEHVYTGSDPDQPALKIAVMTDAGEIVRGTKASPGELDAFPDRCQPGRVSHFATCPNAAGHRRAPAARSESGNSPRTRKAR